MEDIINVFLDEARDQIMDEVYSNIRDNGGDITGLDGIKTMIEARVYDRAVSNMDVMGGDLKRAALKLMTHVADHELYRFLPGEFSSFRTWADITFKHLFTADELPRMIRAVEDMLVPIERMGVTVGDDQVTAETIIDTMPMGAIRETPFLFGKMSDEDKAEFVEQVASGEAKTYVDIKQEAKRRAESSGHEVAERPVLVQLWIKQRQDGDFVVSGVLNTSQIEFLRIVSDGRVELDFGEAQ